MKNLIKVLIEYNQTLKTPQGQKMKIMSHLGDFTQEDIDEAKKYFLENGWVDEDFNITEFGFQEINKEPLDVK